MNDTTSAVESSASVGELLSDARENAGLTVLDIANRLNLTVSVIESLEHNKFTQLPGSTFTRGYIRAYAKLLQLDSAHLVQVFEQQTGEDACAASVHSIDRVSEARRVSRGMLQFSLFVLVLLAIVAAYYVWQSRQPIATLATQNSAVFERVEVERADGSLHVQTLDELEDQAVIAALENHAEDLVSEAEIPSDAVESTESTPLSEEPETVSAESESSISVSEAVETVALVEGQGTAQLSFTQDCWLRILDADGTQVFSGLKRAGEQLAVSGKTPLDVHLGYAKGVSILYNGEAVDFSAAISGETARIKLGQ